MDKGQLFLVGVPIGNDGDMTPRAKQALETVDIIAAEDTRKAKALFNRQNLLPKGQLMAHHAHNEHQSIQGLMKVLAEGKSVALITDAGMPGISDPGYLLVKEARKQNISITCAPGPTAALTALAASGLPSDRFYFFGFLSQKAGERRKQLESLVNFPDTLIFYEAPHRILKTLEDVKNIFGNKRLACLAREITKVHEEFVTGNLSDIYNDFASRLEILGEMVLIVEGQNEKEEVNEAELEEAIKSLLAKNISPKDIRNMLSEQYEIPKKIIYNKILSLKT